VDAHELPGIESLLERAQRVIHEVAAGRRHRHRALALSQEVSDLGDLDELGSLLAEIHADAIGIDRP
jgi:hypothetical protein